MAVEKSIDDCYFYYYSSCTKGDECPFRHCKEALGTETVCLLWKQGSCFRSNCHFRHMESRINRTSIPCYWENQPGGCRKPHCVFMHRKLKARSNSENQSLILPETLGLSPTSPIPNPLEAPLTPPQEYNESDEANSGLHNPVQPLVVSFDEGEESDTESVSSTPVKSGEQKLLHNKNAANIRRTPQKDLGIKTLEQIKMEKIHKESEHFYKSAYDVPTIDAIPKKECYPPTTDFISLSAEMNSDTSFATSKIEALNNESGKGDLRGKLLKKRPLPVSNDVIPAKRTISFMKQEDTNDLVPPKRAVNFKKQEDTNAPLDFKIKTLAEIRKERENKNTSQQVDTQNSNTSEVPSIHQNGTLKLARRTKIIRRSLDSHTTPISETSDLSEVEVKNNKSQSVLHEVQNLSGEQKDTAKVEAADQLVPSMKGKRKAESDDTERSKLLKTSVQNSSSTFVGLNSFLRRPAPSEKRPSSESASVLSEEKKQEKQEALSPSQSSEPTNVPIPTFESSILDAPKPSAPATIKKVAEIRPASIDEFDSFLCGEDDEDLGDAASTGGEDILQEIEQFLDS